MSTFDEMIGMFESAGLAPDAALRAAIGREHSEAEARASWDAHDAQMAAEARANAAMLAPDRPASVPEPGTSEVVRAAREALGMSAIEAIDYAFDLRERKTRRMDEKTAGRWMTEFARSLTSVHEVGGQVGAVGGRGIRD